MAAATVAQSVDPDGDDPHEGKNPAVVELGRVGARRAEKRGRKGSRLRGGRRQVEKSLGNDGLNRMA